MCLIWKLIWIFHLVNTKTTNYHKGFSQLICSLCLQGKEKHQLEQESSELRVQIETIKTQKEHYQRELQNKDNKIQQLLKDLQIMVSTDY